MRERQNSRDSIGGSCSGKAMTLKQGSVTPLQFQDDNTLISASDIDGIIKVRMIDTLIALPITVRIFL